MIAVHAVDFSGILFAKHAQHVVLIHFPIALCLTGVCFDLLALQRKAESLAGAAFYNFSVAALFVIPTIITGILAWQFQLEGARLRGNLLLHLALGVASGIMILAVWMVHFRLRRKHEVVSGNARVVIEAVAVLLVTVTAHLGGIVSGINTPL